MYVSDAAPKIVSHIFFAEFASGPATVSGLPTLLITRTPF
jgi:hypothetical protein